MPVHFPSSISSVREFFFPLYEQISSICPMLSHALLRIFQYDLYGYSSALSLYAQQFCRSIRQFMDSTIFMQVGQYQILVYWYSSCCGINLQTKGSLFAFFVCGMSTSFADLIPCDFSATGYLKSKVHLIEDTNISHATYHGLW